MALQLVPLLHYKPQQIDRDLISLFRRVRKELLIFLSEPCPQLLERCHDLGIRPQSEIQRQGRDDVTHLPGKLFMACCHLLIHIHASSARKRERSQFN
jgi:hypothetical protein